MVSATLSFYYDGSTMFSFLAELIGISVDQVNFLISQFTALCLAQVFRIYLHPSKVSAEMRHSFSLNVGLILGYFCFGIQAVHMAVLPTVCYVIMRTTDPHIMQRVVLAASMFYLSSIHLQRQIYDYGAYTLDITGPLMVITQKVSSLAFSLHDGLTRTEEELTPYQKQQVIRKIPTPLEYYSYVLQFQSLMAGPTVFYADYIDFIHGKHFLKKAFPQFGTLDSNSNSSREILEPSATMVVVKKVIASLLFVLFFVIVVPKFPITRLKDDDFVENTSLISKTVQCIIVTSLERSKYYHAWLLADAICNASGLGFNGYNPDGSAKWDLISNVDVIKFETGLNLRESLGNWNKCTMRWLRFVVYERAPYQKTLLTYLLSALWHGFYPGYYLTFLGGALFTIAGRVARRCIRPYFMGNKRLKFFYDILTWITKSVVIGYITFSFVMLEFWPSIRLYIHMYFWLHICGILSIFALPRVFPTKKSYISAKTAAGAARPLMQDIVNGAACMEQSVTSKKDC